jgi:hypothetical protein
MTRHISLSVNDSPIEIDYFLQGFIDHTVYGMVSSLEGVREINDIEMKINRGDVIILVNGNPLPLNGFAASITGSTVRGMISPLKGVEKPEKIHIVIQR